jgi:hypothetical protein
VALLNEMYVQIKQLQVSPPPGLRPPPQHPLLFLTPPCTRPPPVLPLLISPTVYPRVPPSVDVDVDDGCECECECGGGDGELTADWKPVCAALTLHLGRLRCKRWWKWTIPSSC